jgi:alpha-glucosidase
MSGGSGVPWWRGAVIYQVFVRSFADGDGDGVGDLPGLRSRLPYLRELGVDAVWLSPFYPSPQVDAGYDVADHRDVDPRFGTIADAERLIADAHALGLRVLVDLVPNHTSSEHPWFKAALAAPPGSAERARYLFRDGRGPRGDAPPNDWASVFGGPAWTRVTEADGSAGQWYLHLFAPGQPDLNWLHPEVRAEFESILRLWLDRGVDGFRVDVAHGLAKAPGMPDLAGRYDTHTMAAGHPHWDQDEVHEVYRAWRRVSDAYPGARVFIAEAWVAGPERLARYLRPDELHTAFAFDLLQAPWEAGALHAAIDRTIAALAQVGAPATWLLSSHDVVRHLTRYGGGTLGTRRARAAALLLLALPGGASLYQGEELGLPEVRELPDEVRQDPAFAATAGADGHRDGCRVPLPWSGVRPPFGFGPIGPSRTGTTQRPAFGAEAAGTQPWLPQPAAWAALTAQRQAGDPGSMLALYRQALRLRRELPALGDGDLAWLPSPPDVLAFRREPGFACVLNLGAAPAEPPARLGVFARPLLASSPLPGDGRVPGDTAVWYG